MVTSSKNNMVISSKNNFNQENFYPIINLHICSKKLKIELINNANVQQINTIFFVKNAYHNYEQVKNKFMINIFKKIIKENNENINKFISKNNNLICLFENKIGLFENNIVDNNANNITYSDLLKREFTIIILKHIKKLKEILKTNFELAIYYYEKTNKSNFNNDEFNYNLNEIHIMFNCLESQILSQISVTRMNYIKYIDFIIYHTAF